MVTENYFISFRKRQIKVNEIAFSEKGIAQNTVPKLKIFGIFET